ncbi:MAG: hypothetical protein KGI78_03600 [Patescibacteria group bacterium]|nr:hypothetical protein [Patescibacteria group bacterium]MDE2057911.1 hypothetical protein [Patescibacteria group bacterium]
MQIDNSFEDILSLDGLPFIQALLKYEEDRFDRAFLKGSVYEEMNADFGIFPSAKVYPLYFAGDILHPKDKLVFMGINPGYQTEANRAEQAYLESKGSFEGYRDIFAWRAFQGRMYAYFSHIGGFLQRLGWLDGPITWPWIHEHLLNMNLIAYHSKDTNGLRINDLGRYKHRYLTPILKILDYINPSRPVFINGYKSFRAVFTDPLFSDVIKVEEGDGIWVGTIGRHRFIGLPFLNRPRGGKDRIVEAVKRHLP